MMYWIRGRLGHIEWLEEGCSTLVRASRKDKITVRQTEKCHTCSRSHVNEIDPTVVAWPPRTLETGSSDFGVVSSAQLLSKEPGEGVGGTMDVSATLGDSP